MMKKYSYMQLFAVFAIIAALFCIQSCKKDSSLADTKISNLDNTAFEIKEWLARQKGGDSIAAKKIIAEAQWDKARSFGADSSIFQTVPLITTSILKFNGDKTIQRYLTIRRQQGNIVEGYIYEIFGNADDLLKNQNELIAGFANKKLNFMFNGNLTKLSLSDEFNEANLYQDGKLIQYQKLYKANASN